MLVLIEIELNIALVLVHALTKNTVQHSINYKSNLEVIPDYLLIKDALKYSYLCLFWYNI